MFFATEDTSQREIFKEKKQFMQKIFFLTVDRPQSEILKEKSDLCRKYISQQWKDIGAKILIKTRLAPKMFFVAVDKISSRF